MLNRHADKVKLTCVPEQDRGSVLAPWTRWLPSSASSVPLPSPPARSCYPATLHIHLLPRETPQPFAVILFRGGTLCQRQRAPAKPTVLQCRGRVIPARIRSKARMIKRSSLYAQHPLFSAPLQAVNIPASHPLMNATPG